MIYSSQFGKQKTGKPKHDVSSGPKVFTRAHLCGVVHFVATSFTFSKFSKFLFHFSPKFFVADHKNTLLDQKRLHILVLCKLSLKQTRIMFDSLKEEFTIYELNQIIIFPVFQIQMKKALLLFLIVFGIFLLILNVFHSEKSCFNRFKFSELNSGRRLDSQSDENMNTSGLIDGMDRFEWYSMKLNNSVRAWNKLYAFCIFQLKTADKVSTLYAYEFEHEITITITSWNFIGYFNIAFSLFLLWFQLPSVLSIHWWKRHRDRRTIWKFHVSRVYCCLQKKKRNQKDWIECWEEWGLSATPDFE